MKIQLRNFLSAQKKSVLKAGQGLDIGKYAFFTSSINQTKYINEYDYEQEALIFGTGGKANIHYCNEPFGTSTDCFVFYKKNNVNLKLLYYFLSANIYLLEAGFKGAGLKHISKEYILNLKIDIPDIEIQNHIVAVLDKINILIEQKKIQLGYLDKIVLSRFTELFGDICRNNRQWNIVNLGDLFKVSSSKRIYQNEHMKKGVPFFRIADLMKKIATGSCSTEIFISENKYNELKNSGYVPKSGDILLTSRGTLGECYVITKDDKFYFQDGMISWLSPIEENININYIVHLFCMPEFKKQFSNHTSGSTVDYLSIEKIRRLRIPLPNNNLQNKFDKDIHKIDKSKVEIQKSLNNLEMLKKSLMQQYFG